MNRKTVFFVDYYTANLTERCGTIDKMKPESVGRFLCVAMMLCISLLFGCVRTPDHEAERSASFNYNSYKDIPGVTMDEIYAIETFRVQDKPFVYGIMPSTEAFADDDGVIRGFTALLCGFLTDLFGITFEPKFYEWDDLIAGLENGEIDFTGELTATEERKKTYLMTDPIALRTVKIFRMTNSRPLHEIADSRTLVYAFLEGVITEGEIRKVSELPFESVFVENYEALYNLLKSGKADAFFEESSAEYVFDDYDDMEAEYFFPLVFSEVSMTAQKPSLEPMISVLQKMLKNGGDRYLGELYGRGRRAYLKNRMRKSLTDEERAYINAHPNIPLLAEYDNYPISFYNIREKQWQGASFDVLEEVEALTGLSFNVVNRHDTEWNDLIAMLENGKGSIVSELIRTPEREGRFHWSSVPNARDFFALLSRSDFKDIDYNEIIYMRVGVVRGIAYAEMFNRWFPNHNSIIEYGGGDQMFEALKRGEIDLAMASQNQLLFMTNYRELPGFKINLLFDIPFESAFGFYIGDSLLCSIVDKALRLIDIDGITGRWIRKTYDYRVRMEQEKIPLFLGIGGLFLCVIILAVILFVNREVGKRLEREVCARTAELKESHRELERAVKDAEDANKAKSDFLASMSHEIRTPMNAITGMAELALLENISPPSARENVLTIKQAGANLLSIINDILDLSKIENGKLEIIPADYFVSSLILDVVNIIKTRLKDSAVRFDINVDCDIPSVLFGDEVRVRQILLNILSNAVKYTKEGFISCVISGTPVGDDTVMLTVEVTDTGIGIKEKDIGKLFDNFARMDTEANKGIEGTGLGLPITKKLAAAMGGDIKIKSVYGEGSTFTVTLPQKIRSREPMVLTAMFDRPDEIVNPSFNAPDVRIMVVDDVITNLKVASGLLARYGATVDMCSSGEESVEKAKEKDYDMILMDHMMPGMDGVEAVGHIRSFSGDKGDVTIIALTANAVLGAKEMFLQNGFDDFLPKPINTASLDAIMNKWIPDSKKLPAKNGAGVDSNTDNAKNDDCADIVIDGVDISLGLSKAGGTRDGLLETLAAYYKDGCNRANDINDSLKTGDMRRYIACVHAIRDASANIGATVLSEMAKALENAGQRDDMVYINTNTARFLDELGMLLNGIGNAVTTFSKATAKTL